MATLRAFAEDYIKLISGGVITDDTRFDMCHIEKLCEFYIVRVSKEMFAKEVIPPTNFFEYICSEIIPCDDCSIKFSSPRFSVVNSVGDGWNFTQNKADIKLFIGNKWLPPSVCDPFIYVGDGYLKVYGNMDIEVLPISGICDNASDFLDEDDKYPCSPDTWTYAKELMKRDGVLMNSVQADIINDSNDTPQNRRQSTEYPNR